jgi:S1-C subfamily serine protease
MRSITLSLAVAALATPFALVPAARPSDASDPIAELERRQEALFARVAPSVVLVSGRDGSGSGFFVRTDGLVLTSAHVIGDGSRLSVQVADGRILPGKVVARAGGALDLALVRVPLSDTPALELADTAGLRPGSFAASVGNGAGSGWTFSIGMVANVHPVGSGAPMIQAQLPLRAGSSGAPLIDRDGHVVAIVVAGAREAGGIAFGIRADAAIAAFPMFGLGAPRISSRGQSPAR